MAEPTRLRKRGVVSLAVAGVAVLLVVAVAWWGMHRPFTPLPVPVSSTLQPRPVALAPGLYLLGGLAPAAAYAVETSQGLVLIDSGVEDDAASLKGQLATLGLDVHGLCAILLTHVHADHSQGARHLHELTGARVYAGRADGQRLRDGAPREAFVSKFFMPEVTLHATPVAVELNGGETLTFGETRFEVLAAPGHTLGSVCYLLERPGLRALFAGDTILCLSDTGPLGQLGTYSTYLPPRYRGSARDFLASLRRLRALPVPDLVLPGHPQMDRVPQSPHLTDERWHALLDPGIAAMEKLAARYDADGANFLDGVPKELLRGLHYLGDCHGWAVYCLDTPRGLILFDAPGGPDLVSFLAERFQKVGWAGRKPSVILLTSAGDEATAGLAAVLHDAAGCQVVAPKAGLDRVRRLCPDASQAIALDEWQKNGWLEMRTFSLEGRGIAPVAYLLRWAGRSVLISGRIPVKANEAALDQSARDNAGTEGGIPGYLRSLDQMAALKPDLWLPALPIEGQNANLYDNDWADTLAENRKRFGRP